MVEQVRFEQATDSAQVHPSIGTRLGRIAVAPLRGILRGIDGFLAASGYDCLVDADSDQQFTALASGAAHSIPPQSHSVAHSENTAQRSLS